MFLNYNLHMTKKILKDINSCKKWKRTIFMCLMTYFQIQGGSNMTGTDLCVNKPHCAAAVRP